MSDKTFDLKKRADDILKIAETYGVEQNYFFLTTFKRYQFQMQCLIDLEKQIKEDGMTVTKVYVKGRQNVYSHPALAEYARMSTAADRSVSTLLKIVNSMKAENSDDGDDPLLAILRGDGVDK